MTAFDFSPQSIMVFVGADLVGDALMKMPFVCALRENFPQARITWVAGHSTSAFATVMKPAVSGLIDEVIERANLAIHPWEVLRRPMGGRHFDLIIDTQRVAIRTIILKRIRHHLFISACGDFFFSSRKPPQGYQRPRLMLRQMLDLVEVAAGRPVPTPESFIIPVEPAMTVAASQILPPGVVYVGLAPGAGGRNKCWPLDNFIAVAKHQAEAGRVPVILVGPQEQEWLAPLREAVPEAVFPLQMPGMAEQFGFSPLFTIAVAQCCAAWVCNDSGVGHMLAASGTRLVTLFGPTTPLKFRPMSRDLTILEASQWGGAEMSRIPLVAVIDAVEVTLGAIR